MIYLDNCSTTKPRSSVIKKITETMENNFGNPSSLHRIGMDSEKLLEESRKIIADYLGTKSNEIFFTSGGTESNNLAIQGVLKARKNRGKHIITSLIEHPSVIRTINEFEKEGYRISRIRSDDQGRIDLQELEQKLSDETVLVALIHVNNEIGTIQDIESIGEIISKQSIKPHFHLDGVQSFGKIQFSVKRAAVDSFAFSSHKIHGPKGVGGLYISNNSRIQPLIYGGNQENGLRSGTENIAGIVGFGEAVRILKEKGLEESKIVSMLKDKMLELVLEQIEEVSINSPNGESSSPYILNLSFRWTKGEVLLHYLEEEDIYISTSSACSSKGTVKSHVLKAIGLDDNSIKGTIRLCFSYENTGDDVIKTVSVLKKSVEDIRSIMRR